VYKRSNSTDQGSVSFPTLCRGLRCRNKSFDDFIQHQIQAFQLCPVTYCFLKAGMLSLRSGLFLFHQGKRKSHCGEQE